ncbi:sigma-54-dependent transcriptional regulator [Chitinimonas sp. BJB300]|uniref:sigma-54-dependent transcriptional regulator n=1 Tax=Chitinimonas sp. BJB300 TaxID=1559339 RepID=UPI000C0E39FB|nr:sigma-54 dependent transcriptional regulator [Chitinimonas sp. BJB300]PHV13098.1 sigma-54-dependent Fis family transcriptional regulator [Chitinimonas sp. BJB300]TSJ84695.1 sigma-54-dependent Fis family transcriptional regulator [Chitinimonas sp. BJB300]
MPALPILIVEDDNDLREALVDTLGLAGYQVLTAEDGEAGLLVLADHKIGLVLSDVQMQPMDGETLLHRVKSDYPHIPVVLMTAYGVIEKAVAALHAGAAHYLPKPFEPDDLLATVAKYMLPAVEDEAVIAEDPGMLRLLDMAQRVAQSEAAVMITGESGTGKEVLARYIHRHSFRAHGPFVAINCAAIPEQLLESTLFGHEKGAFTGAANLHIGKFEQADGGTLLLDEISEMPLELQAKLLRVLQEREVERVGGKHPIPIDIRVLSTSNRDMPNEVDAGRFREDLYYRLNVFPLMLPGLRARPDDIVPLARTMLSRHAASSKRRVPTINPAAAAALTAHCWEGNIRELENVMQRALILAPGDEIEPEHLFLPATSRQKLPLLTAEIAASGASFRMPANFAARPAFSPAAPTSAAPAITDIKSLERQHILDTLKAVGGVRKLASEQLGMSERTLRYKLQQYREEGWQEE